MPSYLHISSQTSSDSSVQILRSTSKYSVFFDNKISKKHCKYQWKCKTGRFLGDSMYIYIYYSITTLSKQSNHSCYATGHSYNKAQPASRNSSEITCVSTHGASQLLVCKPHQPHLQVELTRKMWLNSYPQFWACNSCAPRNIRKLEWTYLEIHKHRLNN
jgi:hypothetical protein